MVIRIRKTKYAFTRNRGNIKLRLFQVNFSHAKKYNDWQPNSISTRIKILKSSLKFELTVNITRNEIFL